MQPILLKGDMRHMVWIQKLFSLCLMGLWLGSVQAQAVRVAVSKSPLSLPVYIAKELGYFEKYKVNTELVECLGGFRCFTMMQEGKADLAVSTELPIMFSLGKQTDFSVISTFNTNKEDTKLILKKGVMNSGPKDLIGKKIGLTLKSSSHYFLDLYLLSQGIDPKRIVKVNLAPEQFSKAIKAGEVDGIVAWEPFGFQLQQEFKQGVRLIPTGKLYTQTLNLSVSKSFAKNQPQQIDGILRALRDAITLIHSNPAKAKALLKSQLALDDAFVDYSWPSYYFELSLRQSLITTIQGEIKWAIGEGYVAGNAMNVDLTTIMDPSFLTQIDSHVVDYIYK